MFLYFEKALSWMQELDAIPPDVLAGDDGDRGRRINAPLALE